MMEVFLTSSVLILAIALLRRLLRGRMDPRLQYALWLLVAARLLIPGSLFPAPVSLTGTVERLQTAIQAESTGLPPPPVLAEPSTEIDFQQDSVQDMGDAADPVQPASAPSPVPAGTKFALADVDWPGLVWLLGALLIAGALAVSNLRFWLHLRKSRRRLYLPPDTGAWELPVYLTADLASPCLFGLLHPAVYVNEAALREGRFQHILLHEQTHFHHRDHLWSLLRIVCLVLHWYNPLVWWAALLSRRDCEAACDDGVIRRLGEEKRLDYGETLLRTVAASWGNPLHAATTMNSSKRTMAERITLIARRPRMLKLTLAVVLAVMCAVVVFTFGGAVERPESSDDLDAPPEDQTPEEPPITPEEAAYTRPLSSGTLSSVSYTHFSGLFSLTLPLNWPSTVAYAETEDAVAFYDAAGYDFQTGEGWLMSVVPQPREWAEIHDQNGIPLADFDCNGSPYVYMLDRNEEAQEDERTLALLAQSDQVARSFQLLAGAEGISRLIHDAYQADMPLAVAYLPYLNWSSYWNLYGEDEMQSLLNALGGFVDGNDLTWDQYHDIMSNRSRYQPIDGAYATMIQEGILWPLYRKNPQRFASVLGSEFLTSDERSDLVDWIRFPLSEAQGRANFPEELLTDEEVYYLLGLAAADQVLPEENGEDADPPENGGGNQTGETPQTEPAATLYGSTYGWEMINQWQQSLVSLAYEIPPVPDGDLLYDNLSPDGLEAAVMARLAEHAREAVGDRFDSIILDSTLPIAPDDGESLTVAYRFVVLQTFTFPDGQTVSLNQDSLRQETTFSVRSRTAVMGQIRQEGPALMALCALSDGVLAGEENWFMSSVYQDILSRTNAQLSAGGSDYIVAAITLSDESERAFQNARSGDIVTVSYDLTLSRDDRNDTFGIGTLSLSYTLAD